MWSWVVQNGPPEDNQCAKHRCFPNWIVEFMNHSWHRWMRKHQFYRNSCLWHRHTYRCSLHILDQSFNWSCHQSSTMFMGFPLHTSAFFFLPPDWSGTCTVDFVVWNLLHQKNVFICDDDAHKKCVFNLCIIQMYGKMFKAWLCGMIVILFVAKDFLHQQSNTCSLCLSECSPLTKMKFAMQYDFSVFDYHCAIHIFVSYACCWTSHMLYYV